VADLSVGDIISEVQIISDFALHTCCRQAGFVLELVHLTDQLSNLRIISDYLKVVDFIGRMEELQLF
jgi:hypothetical protein